MKKYCLPGAAVVLAFLCFAASGFSSPLSLESQTPRSITVELQLPEIFPDKIQLKNQGYDRIELPGWARTRGAGAPDLPVTGLLLQVPAQGGVSVEVLSRTTQTLADFYPLPLPGLEYVGQSPALGGGQVMETREEDPAIYRGNDPWPGQLFELGEKSRLRGSTVMRLTVYPFQWNPQTKNLEKVTSLRLLVRFENALPAGQKSLEGHDAATAMELMSRAVANYQGPDQPVYQTRKSLAVQAPAAKSEEFVVQQGWRIPVTETGLYRVYWEDLAAAGHAPPDRTNPASLQLWVGGRQSAIQVFIARHFFDPGDYIEFYGLPQDNQFTTENIYWLVIDSPDGKRMGQEDGTVSGKGKALASFPESLHFEQNTWLWDAAPGAPEEDYWFWGSPLGVSSSPKTYNFTSLFLPDPASEETDAVVRVRFQGYSDYEPRPNHHTKVSLNGVQAADDLWSGFDRRTVSGPVALSSLVNGNNSLSIELPADTGASIDYQFVNWVEVDYMRRLQATGDSLAFSLEGSGLFQPVVEGFTDAAIRLFEVTDPLNVRQITGFTVTGNQGGHALSFDAAVEDGRRFLACGPGLEMTPAPISWWESPNWKDPSRGADYILITDREFFEALQPLIDHRQAQGLRTALVSVQDIYNEFSHGLFDPAALKSLLEYAYHNWQRPAPQYVFLAGDATVDYRNYYGMYGVTKGTRIPVHLSRTLDLGITPDDTWYGCVDGDDSLPDLFVGRVTGDSAQEIGAVANKIIGYETRPTAGKRGVLLVTDNEAKYELFADHMEALTPRTVPVARVDLSREASVAAARDAIVDAVDQGQFLTNYIGHGSADAWAGEGMFKVTNSFPDSISQNDVDLLNNGDRLTLLLSMTCMNGYFAHVWRTSISEAWVLNPDKGAIGAFSPSALAYTWPNEILTTQVYKELFQRNNRILGPVINQALIQGYANGMGEDNLRMFNLLGDPATPLSPQLHGDVNDDGVLDLADAILLLRIAGSLPNTSPVFLWADVNRDGKLDLADALAVIQNAAHAY